MCLSRVAPCIHESTELLWQSSLRIWIVIVERTGSSSSYVVDPDSESRYRQRCSSTFLGRRPNGHRIPQRWKEQVGRIDFKLGICGREKLLDDPFGPRSLSHFAAQSQVP